MKENKNIYKILFYDEGAKGDTQLGGSQLERIELMERLDRERFLPILLTSKEANLAAEARKRNLVVIVDDIIQDFNREKFDRINPTLNLSIWLKHAQGILYAVARLNRFIRKNKIDLIHPNDNLSRIIAGLSGWLTKTPIVTHICDELNRHFIDTLFRLFYLFSFDKIIAVSGVMKDLFAIYGYVSSKIHVIYAGVDLSRFRADIQSSVRRELNLDNSLAVGIVGTLNKNKGHEYLFKALARIHDEGFSFRCLVAGTGPEESNLRRLQAQLALDNEIIFLGFRNDIPQVIQSVDILVCASFSEAFPRVVVEGMAMGKPVIATNVGGIPEAVIDGVTGFLIPPGNVDALYEALKKLINNKELRENMGLNGLKRVQSNFSIEVGVAKTSELYLQLLEK